MTSDGQKLVYDHALNMLINFDKKMHSGNNNWKKNFSNLNREIVFNKLFKNKNINLLVPAKYF